MQVLAIAFFLSIAANLITGFSEMFPLWLHIALIAVSALAALVAFEESVRQDPQWDAVHARVVYDKDQQTLVPSPLNTQMSAPRFQRMFTFANTSASSRMRECYQTLGQPRTIKPEDRVRSKCLDAAEYALIDWFQRRYTSGWLVSKSTDEPGIATISFKQVPGKSMTVADLPMGLRQNLAIAQHLTDPAKFMVPPSFAFEYRYSLDDDSRDIRLTTDNAGILLKLRCPLVVPIIDHENPGQQRFEEYTVMLQIVGYVKRWRFHLEQASNESAWANDVIAGLRSYWAAPSP